MRWQHNWIGEMSDDVEMGKVLNTERETNEGKTSRSVVSSLWTISTFVKNFWQIWFAATWNVQCSFVVFLHFAPRTQSRIILACAAFISTQRTKQHWSYFGLLSQTPMKPIFLSLPPLCWLHSFICESFCPFARLRFVPLTQTCQGMPIASCAQAWAWQSRTDGC